MIEWPWLIIALVIGWAWGCSTGVRICERTHRKSSTLTEGKLS